MVKVTTKNGLVFHEPPYTAEEEADLYRRTGSIRQIMRQEPPKPASADPEADDQSQEPPPQGQQ